jgi:hypothetical protein
VAFTTVTVCAPSSPTTCATIDHIAIDTGSVGLRIPSAVLSSTQYNPNLLAALQNVNPSAPILDCVQFGDGSYFFGTVRSAIVKMGGPNGDGSGTGNVEVASSVPIQVTGDSETLLPTTTCSSSGGPEEDTVLAMGANGLIGIGTTQYDCDVPGAPIINSNNAVTGTFGTGSSNPCGHSVAGSTPPTPAYYACPGSSCTPAFVTGPQQIQNPVALFATDNNGVIAELPPVAAGVGGTNVAGSLVFGIGTQTNNTLGSAVVLPIDTNYSDNAWLGITTVFDGVSYPSPTLANYTGYGNIIDSGSSEIFFLGQTITEIPVCGSSGITAYYCPSSTESLTAYNQATGSSVSSEVPFFVGDTETTGTTAFSDQAAPELSGAGMYFDWGLPFFYGRNVYTAIWGVTPPNGSGVPAGPFWAY